MQIHVVERGQTLNAIAERYDSTAQAIASANQIPEPDRWSSDRRWSSPLWAVTTGYGRGIHCIRSGSVLESVQPNWRV